MNVDLLLEHLKQKKITNIKEIEIRDMSESTLRRRLHKLEELGYVELKHGGKIKLVEETKISIEDNYKENINKEKKMKIAKEISEKIEEGDVIFIDNGTTVRHMLKHITKKNGIIIYTNGYRHINYINKHELDLDIRMIPGKIKRKEASIVGEEAISFINGLLFDKVIIGANGFNDKYVTTPNEDEKNIKREAIKNSLEAYVLIDESKRGKQFKYKVANINEIIIITN